MRKLFISASIAAVSVLSAYNFAAASPAAYPAWPVNYYQSDFAASKFLNPVMQEGRGVTVNIPPQKKESMPAYGIIIADILIPGGGFFFRGDWIYGSIFAAAKASSIYSVYYFYQDYKFRNSLYRSARLANYTIDPSHSLYFRHPDGRYLSVAEYKNESDRAAENIVFSTAANLVIYAVSVLINLDAYGSEIDGAIPSFYSGVSSDAGVSELFLTLKFTGRL